MKIKKPESGNVVHTTSKNENKIFFEHSTKHKIPNGPKSQRTERNCDTNKIEKMHESTHYDTNEKKTNFEAKNKTNRHTDILCIVQK